MKVAWLVWLSCLLVSRNCFSIPTTSPVNYERTNGPWTTEKDGARTGNSNDDPVEEGEMFDQIIETNEAFDADLIEGDIRYEQDETGEDGKREIRSAVRDNKKLWPDGKVFYAFSPGLESNMRAYIYEAMSQIEAATCISFHLKDNIHRNFIRFYNGDGCWSWVGRRGGLQKISLSSHGCRSKGIAMHEILHALGFWHEQARPDRDKYIQILWDNVKPHAKTNFKARTEAEAQMFTEYDFESILHYSSKAFSRNHLPTIRAKNYPSSKLGQRNHLTDKDIKGINMLYKCKVTTTGKTLDAKAIHSGNSSSANVSKSNKPLVSKTTPIPGKLHSNNTTGKKVLKKMTSKPTNSSASTGSWMPWSEYSNCDSSCYRTRKRSCNQKKPNACGNYGSMEVQTLQIRCYETMRCKLVHYRVENSHKKINHSQTGRGHHGRGYYYNYIRSGSYY